MSNGSMSASMASAWLKRKARAGISGSGRQSTATRSSFSRSSSGRRDWQSSEDFICDASKRVTGPVQIAPDPHRSYVQHIPTYFRGTGYSYGTEAKIFNDPRDWGSPEIRKNGVEKIVTTERKALIGSPDLSTLTTCHIERFFLTVRQESTRFTRLTLGYSKKLQMHKLAAALQIGLYNLVRKHTSLDGQTPAQAAGIEAQRWTLEDVVDLTEQHMRAKEDAKFEAAFCRSFVNAILKPYQYRQIGVGFGSLWKF